MNIHKRLRCECGEPEKAIRDTSGMLPDTGNEDDCGVDGFVVRELIGQELLEEVHANFLTLRERMRL